MSPLPNVCIVLITPDSSEIRWVYAVPEPGVRIHGRFPGTWLVIDEVLKEWRNDVHRVRVDSARGAG